MYTVHQKPDKGLRTKGFRTQVLKGIELDIMANDFIAIMAPSGSGKTTLLEYPFNY